MREIALDTETTGLDPASGHRMVEVAAVEMINRVRTGKHFHRYLNPERDVPPEVVKVHGLTEEFLRDKPVFKTVVGDFLDFIGDAPLIIHNAPFDLKFLNAELASAKKLPLNSARVTDTLVLARKKFPGSPASLDALCKRFEIDLSKRTLHGALLDTELLCEVYLELMGGRQESLLSFAPTGDANQSHSITVEKINYAELLGIRHFAPTDEELAAHHNFMKKIKEPLWALYETP